MGKNVLMITVSAGLTTFYWLNSVELLLELLVKGTYGGGTEESPKLKILELCTVEMIMYACTGAIRGQWKC